MINIKIHKMREGAVTPTYGTEHAAGVDLYAVIGDTEFVLKPHCTELINTGIVVEIPDGYYGMICSRSGLTLKNGVICPNAPGIIDSDYRGELKVIIHNLSDDVFVIKNGMRLAQMIIMKYERVSFTDVKLSEISDTVRGHNGFGSTLV